MFKEKIKPSLVITLICLIACALLVLAYEATYVDNTGIITDKLHLGLNEIYSTSDGFEMLTNSDDTVYAPDGVNSVLTDANGNTAFEIVADGYSSGGLHVLIGLDNNGAVSGISILTIGETPGLGTEVKNENFLAQFKGLTYERLPIDDDPSNNNAKKKHVWGTNEEIAQLKSGLKSDADSNSFVLDAITGATLSSSGINDAVTTAINAYNQMKGDGQ